MSVKQKSEIEPIMNSADLIKHQQPT